MKIKKPSWTKEFAWHNQFVEWWDREIEPINTMLQEGVEVYSDLEPGKIEHWNRLPSPDRHSKQKALLINIQPIKKSLDEELDEIFQELIDRTLKCDGSFYYGDLTQRAKRVLEEK